MTSPSMRLLGFQPYKRVCQHALKGQNHIAQGNALG